MDCKIVVVGATTSVGRASLSLLSDFGFAASQIVALSDCGKVKRDISYGESSKIPVTRIGDYDFSDGGIAVFCSTDAIAERYVDVAAKHGCIVVDSTVHSRMKEGVPLVIPHINADVISARKGNIIATPGSIAMQLLTVLYPLQQRVRIERVVLSTYHSASNVGLEGMSELYDQTKAMFMNQKTKSKEFPRQISFNCIPCVGEFADEGHTTEEIGIIDETRKVIGAELEMFATCVTVPVFVANSIAVNLELSSYISVSDVVEILGDAPGVAVVSQESEMSYVTPVDCVNDEDVYVSRVRIDNTITHGLSMWIVADNVKISASCVAQVTKLLAAAKR